MKTVEILPRKKSPLYSTLVRREAAIRLKGLGTFARSGPKRQGSATWKHKRFKGSVNLKRGARRCRHGESPLESARG